MRKLWRTLTLLCVLVVASASVAPAMHYNLYDEGGEYTREENVLLGSPWYKNGGWYTDSPYLWDQVEQEECIWV